MNTSCKKAALAAGLFALIVFSAANADEVNIIAADFTGSGDNRWTIDVTLKHHDTGWDHYADNWRVVDPKGNVLGNRVLYHPHITEQPFTRSLSDVKIPEGITTVYIEAHDKLHGWTHNRLPVDISKAREGHLRVEAERDIIR
ncbi:hypothetical protein DFR30_0207 [Thiogranum longum]|uniref:Uncharacterized protein n=1 Tax=Thiogranum longum TaxID=1537524 RepID=A0A4R1H5J3_9GAMM|nr:hypothetical protein [Thiogranum longum]TCK16987.1 hypothetical protein DFR30_0207 [Thiogranum longum]